jgi:hypothetical protein
MFHSTPIQVAETGYCKTCTEKLRRGWPWVDGWPDGRP